jgi:hypothetical protein
MENQIRNQKPICAMIGCKRKLRLVEMTTLCKCTKAFCITHRHAEYHNCDFNYQAKSTRDLSNALVKVQAEKVEMI